MEKNHKIAAVVVTYNRLEMLLQCLASLERQTRACDILLVDNASDDGTAQKMDIFKKINTSFYYHNMGRNTGGAGGFNYGIRWAAQAGYQYIWLMDDDCLPKPDALEKLLEADLLLGGADHYGFLSSVALWKDGEKCLMNLQKLAKTRHLSQALAASGLKQIEQATFVSLLLPTQTVLKVGLPIKEYFIWGDDIEYTRRIAVRNGLPGILVKQSQVTHAMAQNSGSNIAVDDLMRLDRYLLAFRNESFTYRQEGVAGIVRYLFRCGRSLWHIFHSVAPRRTARVKTLLQGMLAGISFHPQIEYLGNDADT